MVHVGYTRYTFHMFTDLLFFYFMYDVEYDLILLCVCIERKFGWHSLGRMKQWNFPKGKQMFMFSATKTTLMAKEGSSCLLIQNSGEGLLPIPFSYDSLFATN